MQPETYMELCELVVVSRLKGLSELEIEIALKIGGMGAADAWQLMRLTRG
jgi:hypothetical protein